jgi:thymidylate kinase
VERSFALVVTHQSKAGVLGRVAARMAGGPPVVHSLSMADFGPAYSTYESGIFRSVVRALTRWTAGYAVVGSDLASRFRHIGVPAEKLTVIRSAARLPSADADRDQVRERVAHAHGLPEDRPWVLYVGSLEERKCVLELPILLQQLLQLSAGRRPYLVVAGAGPQEERLRALVRQIGLEGDCRLLGHVDDPRDLFVASDIVVLMSRAEGLPQVLVQAAAAGTPFVTTDVDGVDELLELGAPGKVVDVGDVIGAARAALPYLRWPVERNGPTIDLSSWDPRQVQEGYRDLVGSVLATTPSGPSTSGRVVAVVGADGSGKSTLTRALAESFSDREVVHLYLGSGNGPMSLLRWPLAQARRLALGASGSGDRRDAVKEHAPRALEASRSIWALALAQEKRAKLRRARRAARQGALVVCDRYPQAQVPGVIDGPLLDAWLSSSSRWRQRLARWERKPYERAHASQPDLVIRLRVDDETAAGRRPEQGDEVRVARQRVVEDLRFDRAELGIIEMDANRPFDTVFLEARTAITERLLDPSARAS